MIEKNARAWRAGPTGRGLPMAGLSLVIFGLALVASGCSQVPQRQLDRAEQSLSEARAAGAERYATETLEAAEALWAETLREVEHQRGRRAVSRTFRRVDRMASDVERLATEAATSSREAAVAHAVRARAEIARAATAVSVLAAAVERVPAGRDVAEDSARMRRDLRDLEQALAAARGALDAGAWSAAEEQADHVAARAEATADLVERTLRHLVRAEPLGPDVVARRSGPT